LKGVIDRGLFVCVIGFFQERNFRPLFKTHQDVVYRMDTKKPIISDRLAPLIGGMLQLFPILKILQNQIYLKPLNTN
jgi:hypothetical protein